MTSNALTTNMKKHQCKVCDKSFDTERQLHAHLKAHKMRMAEYYQTYYPRHDKHDGKIIKFKSKEQYFACDFNSRTNLKNWIKSAPKEEVKDYCKKLLIDRKEKNAPIQSLEERYLQLEAVKYVDSVLIYETEEDLYNLLKKLNPDIRILGADHKGKDFTGHDLEIKNYFNSRNHSYSSSELRKRIYFAEREKWMGCPP